MPALQYVYFILIGLTAGVLSGMFGLGGGLIMVPAMGFMGMSFKAATGTSLAAQLLPFAILGVVEYYKNGDVNVQGALILVCDQPYITVDLINQLIRVQKKSGKPIAASAYENIAGTPAIFHQSFFTELTSLQGDKGAGKILKQVPDSIATVDFPLGSFDIDTQEDYDNWKANLIPHKAGENEEM